ncbi:MAG: SpoIIE family protein phosphatase [Burkholderiales bacterium]|jgi:phosphoserine phosphatase|nr:SpoIIE family protein phosphatase [Burkholderiales bacterium]
MPAHDRRRLPAGDLEALLDVTSALAAPFDLMTMLGEVVSAAKQVLRAERGSVWLHEPATDELVLRVATGIAPVRVRSGSGLVGACARERRIINVPDCYADPRFDPGIDRASGYRTRCMLTLPLVDHKDVLVGVMQVLNKRGGAFDADDERLATALAAQCAVALQRVRMTEAVIEGEKMRQALEMARVVQMSTLPSAMPRVPGYDVCGTFRPAELTGGDTYDVALIEQGLLVVLGDATGHGIAPALSVTQMHAMLRMAFRLGASLDEAYLQVNNRLAETLAEDRFITAFIGLLDPASHRLAFHSGGQGPIFHFRAAARVFDRHKPTSFPLGAMPLASARAPVEIAFAPGDVLVLLSDGFYEQAGPDGGQFGEARVEALIREHHELPAAELLAELEAALRAFANGAPQEDDMTAVLVKRAPAPASLSRHFSRSFDSIAAMVAFTADAFERLGIDTAYLATVDFVVEELFTNMVKYATGSASAVELEVRAIPGGVEAVLTDRGVEPFDVTRAPEADVHAPLERRRPGGLGLHLIRRMVDALEYRYDGETRESRTTFRKTGAGRVDTPVGAGTGEADAGH